MSQSLGGPTRLRSVMVRSGQLHSAPAGCGFLCFFSLGQLLRRRERFWFGKKMVLVACGNSKDYLLSQWMIERVGRHPNYLVHELPNFGPFTPLHQNSEHFANIRRIVGTNLV